jgi:hypothetical protein
MGWLVCAFFAVWLATPRDAAALDIAGKAAGFNLPFSPEGATICALRPVELTNPADCAGIDIAQVRATFPEKSSMHLLVVRRDETSYLVLSQLDVPGQSAPTQASVAEFADGYIKGAARTATSYDVHAKNPAKPGDLVEYGPAKVIRLHTVFTPKPGSSKPPLENLSYVIPGDGATYTLLAIVSPDVVDLAARDFEAALSHLKIDPAKDRAYAIGRAVGEMMGTGLALATLCLVVLIPVGIFMLVRKKRSTPS